VLNINQSINQSFVIVVLLGKQSIHDTML